MYTGLLQLLLGILTSSAISVGMLAFGFRTRRTDGSRRWIFVVGGVIGCLMTIPVGFLSIGEIGREGSLLVLILCVIVLLTSLILLRHGIRGQRVGDHPYCRRCGFDLFGRPETSHQCSECGADINDSRAIVIGVRRRRASLIFSALFLMLMSLGIGVPVVWTAFVHQINWYKFKPDWWLVQDWDPSIPPFGRSSILSEANSEIVSRMIDRKFNASSRNQMARILLSREANRLPRSKDWDEFLINQARQDAMDPQLLQALVPLNTRAKLQIHAPCVAYLPIFHRYEIQRRGAYMSGISVSLIRDEINGTEIAVENNLNLIGSSGSNLQDSNRWFDIGDLWHFIVPADHKGTIEIEWSRTVETTQRVQNGSQVVDCTWQLTSTAQGNAIVRTSIPVFVDGWTAVAVSDGRNLRFRVYSETRPASRFLRARAFMVEHDGTETFAGDVATKDDWLSRVIQIYKPISHPIRLELRPDPQKAGTLENTIVIPIEVEPVESTVEIILY